jgi:excisionase family DNA binding protein
MAEREELLTVKEVAERLRLSEETIRRWARKGQLRAVRMGATRGGWRVYASDVADLLAGVKQLPVPAAGTHE